MIDLLDRIIAAGGDVAVVGGDLRLRVPSGLLTQAERSLLAENKAEIVKLLADRPGPAAETPVVGTMAERVVDPDLGQQAEPVEFTYAGRNDDQVCRAGRDEAEIVAPPPPCQQCGGSLAWWDIAGGVALQTVRAGATLSAGPGAGGAAPAAEEVAGTQSTDSPNNENPHSQRELTLEIDIHLETTAAAAGSGEGAAAGITRTEFALSI